MYNNAEKIGISTSQWSIRTPFTVFITLLALFVLLVLPCPVHGHPVAKTDRSLTGNGSGANQQETLSLMKPIEPVTRFNGDRTLIHEEISVVLPKRRLKRLSDQRRAELETLMALSKMTGKLVTVSRGGRQLDPAKIGRRRRSVLDNLKNISKNIFQLSANLDRKKSGDYVVTG